MKDLEPPSVGVDRLDGARRQIARRIRAVSAAVRNGGRDDLRVALRILGVALEEHWAAEEAWMAEQGYPAAREHERIHMDLLARAAELRRQERAAPDAAADLAASIEAHLWSEDLRVGRFFAARENFRRMGGVRGAKGLALTPIPGALEAFGPLAHPALTPTPGGLPSLTPPGGTGRKG